MTTECLKLCSSILGKVPSFFCPFFYFFLILLWQVLYFIVLQNIFFLFFAKHFLSIFCNQLCSNFFFFQTIFPFCPSIASTPPQEVMDNPLVLDQSCNEQCNRMVTKQIVINHITLGWGGVQGYFYRHTFQVFFSTILTQTVSFIFFLS